jgi:hypothetical protein
LDFGVVCRMQVSPCPPTGDKNNTCGESSKHWPLLFYKSSLALLPATFSKLHILFFAVVFIATNSKLQACIDMDLLCSFNCKFSTWGFENVFIPDASFYTALLHIIK